jgi:hypothetical protein
MAVLIMPPEIALTARFEADRHDIDVALEGTFPTRH